MKQFVLKCLLICVWIMPSLSSAFAADDASATIKQANDLMEHLYWHHEDHAAYFLAGNIYSELFLSQHPIRDYHELQTYLYNISLYYGNCLHYAKEQSLRQDIYLGVPHAGKRPTYEELARELTSRIARAKVLRMRSQELYEAYYQLYDDYETCRMLYVEFAQSYPREKMAHLLLDSARIELLNRLSITSDSVQMDIARYQNALQNYPIADYSPEFRWQDIRLYRIDGLTKTEFLQSDVVLWNYRDWVSRFLDQQNTLYRDYYQSLSDELAGKGSSEHLLNTINRLDYESFLHTWFAIRQNARLMQSSASAPWINAAADDYLAVVLPHVLSQYNLLQKTIELNSSLPSQLSDAEMAKYSPILTAYNLNSHSSILADANQHLMMARTAYRAICHQVAEQAVDPTASFVQYTNELTGERVDLAMLSALGITDMGRVVAVLPLGYQYIAILNNHRMVCFDATQIYGDPVTFTESPSAPVLAAYKLSANTIAILSSDNIFFIKPPYSTTSAS